MHPIEPLSPGLQPAGPPVAASSEDDNVPAVQGTSLSHEPFDPTKWSLAGGIGVSGASGSGSGVTGTSVSGVGVIGSSQSQPGVQGQSASGWGVLGSSQSGTSGGGVWGDCTSGTGVQATSGSGTGLQATSNTGNAISASSTGDTDAIVTTSSSPNHAALSGTNSSGGYGIWVSSTNSGGQGGIGIYSAGAKYAGEFQGDVTIVGQLGILATSAEAVSAIGPSRFQGDVYVHGTVNADVDVVVGGGDCAEDFDVAVATVDFGPGTVMVLTEDGALQPSQHAYDKKVVGVISGAGDERPGLILGRSRLSENRMPLALVGKVYCKADAQYGPIEVGDLLTTSPTAGHAMRAADPLKAFGAVIGKALHPLRSGQGLVRILVALQ